MWRFPSSIRRNWRKMRSLRTRWITSCRREWKFCRRWWSRKTAGHSSDCWQPSLECHAHRKEHPGGYWTCRRCSFLQFYAVFSDFLFWSFFEVFFEVFFKGFFEVFFFFVCFAFIRMFWIYPFWYNFLKSLTNSCTASSLVAQEVTKRTTVLVSS